jgi:5-methylcytosine-specific restriction endonuclease McrA
LRRITISMKPKKEKIKKPRTQRTFRCAQCHGVVASSIKKRYCSKKCSSLINWRTQKHKRRAWKRDGQRGESIGLPELLKRDKYICGLCHRKIKESLRYPHPQSPSLDHIVPLSKGGSHEWKNVQSSHHACNQAKRSKPMGQLRIC